MPKKLEDYGYSATATGTDIRVPSTAVLGISSADRHVGPLQPVSPTIAEWDPLVTYNTGDLVRQGPDYFTSLVNNNIGNDPALSLGVQWDITDEPVGYVSRPGAGSPFDFVITNRGQLLNGFFTRIAVSEFSFVWAIPTITSRNNRMCIKYRTLGVGPVFTAFFSIPTGWAQMGVNGTNDTDTIVYHIQTAVRAIGAPFASFTCNANADTGIITANTNTATTFAFVPVNAANPIANLPSTLKSQYLGGRTQLYDQLGWAVGGGTITGEYTLNTIQISAVPSLLSTRYVDVVCNKLTANQNSRDGSTNGQPRDILCRLYLEASQDALNPEKLGSQPFRVYRDFSNPKVISWDPSIPVAGLEFQLFDDQGFPLSTYQTSATELYYNDKDQPDWNCSLLCSEQ